MKSIRSFFSHPFITPLAIFLLALIIRLWNLGTIPYGFHMDEVANTYVGRFILLNGKDLYGNVLPILYFNKFGDYPPVIPMYLSGLASFIFGLNTFASRFPSAFIGSLMVFPLYSLFKNISSKTIAVVGCLCLAILPWHVVLSRSSAEGVIGLTVFVTGLAFLVKGIKEQKSSWIYWSWLWFGLSYLLYPSFRVLAPIVLLPTPFLTNNIKLRKILILTIIVFFAVAGLVASTQWGKGRFEQTSLFSNSLDRTLIQNDLLTQSLSEGNNSALVAHIFHNKPIGYGQRLLDQYLNYFSPSFLFIKGGLPARYQIPHVGLLYSTFLLLFLIYIAWPKVKVQKSFSLYCIYLLLISVIPAAIAVDDFPNVHRSIFMIIPLLFFVAIAIVNFFEVVNHWKKWIKISVYLVVGSFFVLEMIYASHQYFVLAGKMNSFYRTDGNVQMAEWLVQNKDKYPEIIVPNDNWLAVYYLFATNDFNPSYIGKFQQDFNVGTISNIHFLNNKAICPEPKDFAQYPEVKGSLLIIDGNCDVTKYVDYHVVGEIKRVDESAAYRLLMKNSSAK